jgi:hypothetical protein
MHGYTQPDLENLWIILLGFFQIRPSRKKQGSREALEGVSTVHKDGRGELHERYTEGCKITLTTISFAPPGEFCGQL